MEYFADLHIHSCLSPCGDEDMTPANICGMAKLKGLDAKLSNPGFLNKAPADVVAAEKERGENLRQLIAKLEQQLAAME